MNTDDWSFYVCTLCDVTFGVKTYTVCNCPECKDPNDVVELTKEEAFE